MKCPRDGGLLRRTDPRQECAGCKGIFLPEAALLTALGYASAARFAAERLLKLRQSELRCPRDREFMRLVNHHGVEIEICPACHSIWLDCGEYEKIESAKRKKQETRDDADIDLDLSSGDSGGSCSAIDGVDLPVADILHFIGDAIGSIFDGL